MTRSLLLKNVRPWGGAARDVAIRDGRIAPDDAVLLPGTPEEDGDGEIVIPGLVEAHTHLDKSLWGLPWYVNEVGPKLLDKIDNERAEEDPRHRPGSPVGAPGDPVLAKGSTHIRTHVDVDTEHRPVGRRGRDGDPRRLSRHRRHRARRLPAIRPAAPARHARTDGRGDEGRLRDRRRARPLRHRPRPQGPSRCGLRALPELRQAARHPPARARRDGRLLDWT